MTKVLLLGLGRWGANHLRNLASLPVELWVADTDSKRLEPARKAGVPADRLTTDYRDFLPRVQAVVIVTPAPTHFALGQECLAAGKDVFIEKPLTLHSGQARQLAESAGRQQRILQVGHILRFDPATQWLRKSIQDGKFGHVRILRTNFSGFKRPRSDSGILLADAVHFVDLCNFLLERQPARVLAVAQDFLGRGMEDAALLSLEYLDPDGAVTWATVETNYFFPGKRRELTVIGSHLSAVCDFNLAEYKIKTFAHRHVPDGREFKALEGALHQVENPTEEPLFAELRAFVQAVETRRAPGPDGWAGYHSVRIVEAALESAKTGRVVALK